MSGKSATQGFIYQTLVALLDCLARDDWDAIKMEPGTDADKTDYQLYRDGRVIFKVQVKSSRIKYTEKMVSNWFEELKKTKSDPKIYLYLVCDNTTACRDYAARHVEIKTLPFSEMENTCLVALLGYCDRKKLDAGLVSKDLVYIYDCLFSRIHNNGIEEKPLGREEFEKVFHHFVSKRVRDRKFRKAAAVVVLLVSAAVGIHTLKIRDMRRQIDRNTAKIASLVEQLSMVGVKSDGFTSLYQAALDLYNTGEYKAAAKTLEQALEKQIIMTGYESRETAALYLSLGLAYLYGGDVVENDGDNAISALTAAGKISENIGDSWGALQADFSLATAYYELREVNTAEDMCSRTLAETDRILGNADHSQVLAAIDGTADGSPAVFPDCEKVYMCCRAYALQGQLYDLLGKISSATGDVQHVQQAFDYFSYSLSAMSHRYECDAVLSGMGDEALAAGNEDIQEYVQSLDGIDFISRKTEVSAYFLEGDEYVLTVGEEMPVYRGSAEATALANRAQFAVALGMFERAEEDCRKALEIWEDYEYSERINISYALRWLIAARLGRLQDQAQADGTIPEDELSELLDYADSAVTYDVELFGKDHWRTAFSYETRGPLYILAGDRESALADFRKAYEINSAWHDEEGAAFDLTYIDGIQSS